MKHDPVYKPIIALPKVIRNPLDAKNLSEWFHSMRIDKNCTIKHKDKSDKCLYVFGNSLNKTCKIGIAKDIRIRQLQLQANCGYKLHLLISINLCPTKDPSGRYIEEAIHSYFKSKRKLGEWFDLSLRDILMIRDLLWEIEGDDIRDQIHQNIMGHPNSYIRNKIKK